MILQVVPDYPPAISGVGDYAMLLNLRFSALERQKTRVLICTPSLRSSVSSNSDISVVPARTGVAFADSLVSCVGASARCHVILQLSVYGFEKRGCPFWLLSGLGRAKRQLPQLRVTTYFHELFASGNPRSRSFWLGHVQRCVLRGILRLSDNVLTNTAAYASWISQRRSTPLPVTVLPVACNVGEPDVVPALDERQHQIAVFGKPETRRRLQRQASRMQGVSVELNNAPFVPVGAPDGAGVSCGSLAPGESPSASAISGMLASSQFGALEYPTHLLAKSGVFAAYCTHGAVPIIFGPYTGDHDGLIRGRHFLMAEDCRKSLPSADLVAISNQARAWYAQHSLEQHCRTFLRLLEDAA